MKYMLDTNICVYIIKKKPPQVLENLMSLRIFLAGIKILPFDESAAIDDGLRVENWI